MVDKCLSATSPIRFLKAKEKAREAEREKMGLISKAREQEIQKLKKKGEDFDSPMIIGTPGTDLITLAQSEAAESTLLRLKKEAIEALPENMKAAALVPNLTPFPMNRFMATLTPPIEGYIEKINEAARKSAGKEKLR
ncbi:Hypothetical predicted protein [Olea europaea subsp. europaea]|uniref:Uncharacterized protein n=1 Tax=Olea europaea subsp. europaea TaxID=158383 RepID=A0A8S0S1D0_OLEEU|nr:Hypothetical predicted protein [Olea europaea subsp. europaea]